MRENYFTKYIDVNESVETIFGWHERVGAFERLTPPWMKLKNVIKSGNGIETGAKVDMDICFANIPFPIRAEHIGYEKNSFFKDRLSGGIFSKWEHTHKFYPLLNNVSFSRLEDRIDYALPFHIPDNWHSLIKSELYRLFNYRHTVMVNDLERHRLYASSQIPAKTLKVLISGASGPVGNALIPFLTTAGHKVVKLVRTAPKAVKTASTKGVSDAKEVCTEIAWNPYTRELDLEQTGKIDVVINLNGYHIGSGRWSHKLKDIIVKSRNLSTTLLAEKISNLPADITPELFISASATGFYGDCGDSCVDENSCCGDLFISNVCSEWEKCALKAQESGIRTIFARMGVVLTPAGGALERLLPAFIAGAGSKIGTGRQYMSWITIDDLVYAIFHMINDKSIDGAVNVISPNPVTNEEFTHTLAKVVSKPAPFRLPSSLIRMIWGQMGEEVLLASTKALPYRLMSSGFKFSYPTLEQALRHLIGRWTIKL